MPAALFLFFIILTPQSNHTNRILFELKRKICYSGKYHSKYQQDDDNRRNALFSFLVVKMKHTLTSLLAISRLLCLTLINLKGYYI